MKKSLISVLCALYVAVLVLTGCGKTDTQDMESEPAEEKTMFVSTFTTKDLDGNTVTEAIFSEKDLTVVNVWGTFCSPCVGEMPELGEWAKAMPENVQIVGLIIDIAGEEDKEHLDLAVEITEKAGADFVQIIANEDFTELMKDMVGVPTTYFVDKNGCVVGEPVLGADVEGYKKAVEDYLNEQ